MSLWAAHLTSLCSGSMEHMPLSSVGSGVGVDLESAGGAEEGLLPAPALNGSVALGLTLLAGPQFPRLEWGSCGEAERKPYTQTCFAASKKAAQI